MSLCFIVSIDLAFPLELCGLTLELGLVTVQCDETWLGEIMALFPHEIWPTKVLVNFEGEAAVELSAIFPHV